MYKIENTCISFKVKNLNYFEYWELDSVIDTALISFLFDDKLISYNKWNKTMQTVISVLLRSLIRVCTNYPYALI